MNCKVICRMDLEHMSFQYLIDTVYFLSRNTNENHLAIGYWVKNVERFQKNEGGDQSKIFFNILLMTSSIYSWLITIFQAMTSLLGNLSYGFGDDGVVWYVFFSELVANINGCVLIETGDVIWLYAVDFLLGGTVNSAIQ